MDPLLILLNERSFSQDKPFNCSQFEGVQSSG